MLAELCRAALCSTGLCRAARPFAVVIRASYRGNSPQMPHDFARRLPQSAPVLSSAELHNHLFGHRSLRGRVTPTIGLASAGSGVDRDHYTVWFSSVDPRTTRALGSGDFRWCVTVAAGSEAEALELGLADARELNREFGLPPHGIRVSEEKLRGLAYVQLMGYG